MEPGLDGTHRPGTPRADDALLELLSVVGRMTMAMSAATSAEEIHRHALDAIERVTGARRASVLLFDPDGVMRFKAWRGLSDRYRTSVEGHTPWRRGQPHPEPLLVDDVRSDPGLQPFLEVIAAEGIGSMAMFPLCTGGGTIGKFMVYHPGRHTFGAAEVQLVANVAAHTAFALDRQRAVDALRESEERTRSVVDHLQEVVFRVDGAGRLVFLNPSWSELTGRAVGESLGRPLADFVHPEDRAATLDLDDGARDGGEPRRTLRFLDAGGRVRIVEVFARRNRLAGDDRTVVSGTLTDVTERRATAERLRTAERSVFESQRLESLGLLAGGIAHDFNNLLMGVLGNASLLLEDLPPGSPLRPSLDDIAVTARRAADLTRQLLAYAGKGQFVVEDVDLSAVARECTRLLGPTLSRKATVRVEVESGLPPVEADGTQLRQVVMNFVTNASDALGDAPGTVEVRTGVVSADADLLARAAGGADLVPGPYVFVEVRDTGSGMDAATRARIFDPFFTTKFQGRGLGLSAALGVARAHRGAILVESAPGRGTRIALLLPPRAGHAIPPAPVEGGASGVPTVLVVDDEEMVRRVACTMLERSGYRVRAADSGPAALAVLEAGEPVDAVLLDLTMPELSGEETLRRLRPRWPRLPVVLTSGFSTEAQSASQVGADGFLAKPYALDQLVEAIDGVLRKRGDA